MLQTQSYNDVLNMACMLPLREKKQLIRDIEVNIHQLYPNDALCPYTWDELRAGVSEAEEQIAHGEVYSSEEDDRLFDEFLTEKLGVAL